MANSKKVKRIHICPTCKGNGQVHQCWDCDSEGEFVEYVEEQERVLN